MDEFDQFWATFPSKIGKLAARRAYARARTQASAAEILDGVRRYIAHKPEYADWCHPRTFLSQGRWMDEYDVPIVKASPGDWCQHVPKCHSPVWHQALVNRERESA